MISSIYASVLIKQTDVIITIKANYKMKMTVFS